MTSSVRTCRSESYEPSWFSMLPLLSVKQLSLGTLRRSAYALARSHVHARTAGTRAIALRLHVPRQRESSRIEGRCRHLDNGDLQAEVIGHGLVRWMPPLEAALCDSLLSMLCGEPMSALTCFHARMMRGGCVASRSRLSASLHGLAGCN
jgi:hypothetical protein